MRIFFSIKSFAVQLIIVICSLLFFSSCVTEKEFLYLNDQMVALNKRVDSLQEVMDRKLSTELNSGLMSVREQQAKGKVELDKIREDMQGVSDRLDDNNRLVRRAIERDTTAQDDMSARVGDLKDRISELETSVKRLNAYLSLEPVAGAQAQDQKKGPVMAQSPEPPAPVVKEPTPVVKEPAPVIEKPDVSPEKRLYDVNLALYREERYEETIAGFKNFLEKYPESELADNAQYWVGESYMALKQYEQAILAFQRVIKKYPKGNKVPNAILRQALAFYEIKDKTSSKLLLKKLIKQFPKSSEAKIAKGKLKAME